MTDIIRVSAANLAKIPLDDKLLVALNKSRLKKGKMVYTPFGGAIEFEPEARAFLNGLEAEFEKGNDLRFTMPEENIAAFENWFMRAQDRELNPYRELREELVEEEQVLDKLGRNDLVTAYLGTAKERAETDRPGQEGQVTQRFLEVFDVEFQPEYQAKLKDAAYDTNTRLALVTPEEIEQGKTAEGIEVATNCLPFLQY